MGADRLPGERYQVPAFGLRDDGCHQVREDPPAPVGRVHEPEPDLGHTGVVVEEESGMADHGIPVDRDERYKVARPDQGFEHVRVVDPLVAVGVSVTEVGAPRDLHRFVGQGRADQHGAGGGGRHRRAGGVCALPAALRQQSLLPGPTPVREGDPVHDRPAPGERRGGCLRVEGDSVLDDPHLKPIGVNSAGERDIARHARREGMIDDPAHRLLDAGGYLLDRAGGKAGKGCHPRDRQPDNRNKRRIVRDDHLYVLLHP
ncbi:hypothetical protein DSECCO2_572800 [anaerobic digester metagenome]